jgi:hypothetical protein
MLGNAIADIAGATACRIADGIVGLCNCHRHPSLRVGARARTAGGGVASLLHARLPPRLG